MKSRAGDAVPLTRATPRICKVPGCGRPRAARELCQTHDRQLRTTGELTRIRPYRARSSETVQYAGFRLSPECAEHIEQLTFEQGRSRGAVITEILEEWGKRGARAPRATPVGSGHPDARPRRPPARRRR